MKPSTRIAISYWFLVATFFIAGIFLGGLVIYLYININNPIIQKLHPAEQYKYINPLLGIELGQKISIGGNRSLELALNGLIEKAKSQGTVSKTSIYYRDIEEGTWIGVNENQTFSAGVLLKIPIMISYFKFAETEPNILTKQLTYYQTLTNPNNIFKNQEPLQNGNQYSVDDLIHQMIAYNDDAAANTLFENMDKKFLNEIFSDLGINFIEDNTNLDFISTKENSLFFRILYNATYLNRNASEKSLEILSEATDMSGMMSQIPKIVQTAVQFGGRVIPYQSQQLNELFGCGVVYYPKHPYILCTSAQGSSVEKLKQLFGNIGKLVYDEVDYKYHGQ